MTAQEAAIQKAAKESEARKRQLKDNLKVDFPMGFTENVVIFAIYI